MQNVATVVFTLALFFCFIPVSYAYETFHSEMEEALRG
jgi:hypothetical protein